MLDAHQRAMALFDRAVHQIRDDQWDGPTPCTEWSARAVVNHLVAEQLWVPHLMRGETIAHVGDRYQGSGCPEHGAGVLTGIRDALTGVPWRSPIPAPT